MNLHSSLLPDSAPRRRLDHTPTDPLADPEVQAMLAELAATARGVIVLLAGEPEAAAVIAAVENYQAAGPHEVADDCCGDAYLSQAREL